MPLGHGGTHDVVKHRVVTGMPLDDSTHGGDFVGVEDRAEVAAVPFEHRGQAGGDAHVFVREDHARLARAAYPEGMQRLHRRRAKAHVLLEVIHVFILRAFQPELAPAGVFEVVDLVFVEARDVDEQHLGRRDDAGRLVRVTAPPVDDVDVVMLLDLAKAVGERRAVDVVQAAEKHLPRGAEALLAIGIGRPIRADENIAVNVLEVHLTGEQPLEHRPDAADLLDCFVSDVDDRLH